MLTTAKADLMNAKVQAFLDSQFPHAPGHKLLFDLWRTYLALELPNEHFVTEFTNGKKECLFQRSWEMMLARHLEAQGHRLASLDHGPDFRFKYDGRTIWAEAISPMPTGMSDEWMTAPQRECGSGSREGMAAQGRTSSNKRRRIRRKGRF
jgi:hypothetical protein